VKLSAPLIKSEVKRDIFKRHYKPGPFKKEPPKWLGHPWSRPPGAGSLPANLQGCDRNITPACLKALYKIPDAHLSDPANVMGLYESGDTYSQEDLNLFFAKYAPDVPQGTHPKLDSIDGGQAPVAPGSELNTGESDIDMDIAYSLIYVSGFLEDSALIGINKFLAAKSYSLPSRRQRRSFHRWWFQHFP
jgi:tripeptidyl-peptidase-1